MKKISILGATGSVGVNTLKIISSNKIKYNVIALTANKNYKKLARFALAFKCKYAVIGEKKYFNNLKEELHGSNIKCLAGYKAICEVSSFNVDILISAIVGIAGLKPTFASIGNTKVLAIANKESVISAGNLLLKNARLKKTKIIPLDSEHNAIYQILHNEKKSSIKNIILTASGGPFLRVNKKNFKNITVADALKHPNWKMGKKITIDSATLVNKVIEVIEASILFDLNLKQIDILIHPASLIHGIVNFIDGSSHLVASSPDMKVPISYALNWPDRTTTKVKPINLVKDNDLNFIKPDYKKFSALSLKRIISNNFYQKSSIIVLNAANEIAVDNFLKKNIEFDDIVKTIKKTIYKYKHIEVKTLKDVLSVDYEA
ncbi:MAG: 1-deoxy-D-xylulose-5-phosphate reductoisomerase, partial [Pseudomonadota bacterium]|nr:1-deoxy-D-xylulose-5-phosphate reductoisomerase [Pseudomonadota bacterium]